VSSRLQVFSFFAAEEFVQLVEKIKEFIDMEGRSCSMDIDGITPEYVHGAGPEDGVCGGGDMTLVNG